MTADSQAIPIIIITERKVFSFVIISSYNGECLKDVSLYLSFRFSSTLFRPHFLMDYFYISSIYLSPIMLLVHLTLRKKKYISNRVSIFEVSRS